MKIPMARHKLKCCCWNCYHKWEEEVPIGAKVYDNATFTGLRHEQEVGESRGKTIVCPHCHCDTARKRYS